MIYGLTHKPDGQVQTRLAVTTKFAIGLPKTHKDNKGHPSKLDHFMAESKNAKGEWIEDVPLIQSLQEKYSSKGPNGYNPLREFDVVFLSDEIEEIFKTEYAMWSATERQCSGDGLKAMRAASIIKDKDTLAEHPNERYIEWTPCGDTCPEKIAKKCKPSGQLLFMLLDRPTIGSVCAFYTTSYRTIVQIHSSLTQVQQLTGGRLRGIPLRMVMKPGRTSYSDKEGKRQNSNAFFVHLEFRQKDHTKIISGLLDASLQVPRAEVEHIKKLKSLGPAVKLLAAETDVIEELEDDEVAAHMTGHFTSDDDDHGEDDAQPQETTQADLSEIDATCKAFNITQARRDVVIGHFRGDIANATAWFKALSAEFNRLNLNASTVDQLFQSMGMQPEALLKHVAELQRPAATAPTAPTDTPRRQRRTKAQMEAANAPAATSAPAASQDTAAPKEAPPKENTTTAPAAEAKARVFEGF